MSGGEPSRLSSGFLSEQRTLTDITERVALMSISTNRTRHSNNIITNSTVESVSCACEKPKGPARDVSVADTSVSSSLNSSTSSSTSSPSASTTSNSKPASGAASLADSFETLKTVCDMRRCNSHVVLARHKPTQQLFVLKHLRPGAPKLELTLHRPLRHKNITKMSGYYRVGDSDDKRLSSYVMILEYSAGGTLADYVERHGSLSEAKAARYTGQLCAAVEYLHSQRVAHCDIKLDNVLLSPTAEHRTVLKLCDFGLAVNTTSTKGVRLPPSSLCFMSPEMHLAEDVDAPEKVDVWALGVCAYVMLTGRYPFIADSVSAIRSAVVAGNIDVAGLSEGARSFIRSCLNRDPRERPDARSLAAHPWLCSFSEEEK
eukprot:PhM_4_TR12906/c0_g1_i1/m.105955